MLRTACNFQQFLFCCISPFIFFVALTVLDVCPFVADSAPVLFVVSPDSYHNHTPHFVNIRDSSTPDLILEGELGFNQSVIIQNCTYSSVTMNVLFHPGSSVIVTNLQMPNGNFTVNSFPNATTTNGQATSYCTKEIDVGPSGITVSPSDSRFIQQSVTFNITSMKAQKLFLAPNICVRGLVNSTNKKKNNTNNNNNNNNNNNTRFIPVSLKIANVILDGAHDVDGGGDIAVMHFEIGRTFDPSPEALGREPRRVVVVLDSVQLIRNTVQCALSQCGAMGCKLVAFMNPRSKDFYAASESPATSTISYDAVDGSNSILVAATSSSTSFVDFANRALPTVLILGNSFRENIPSLTCPLDSIPSNLAALDPLSRERYFSVSLYFPFRFVFANSSSSSSSSEPNVVDLFVNFTSNKVSVFSQTEGVRLSLSNLIVDMRNDSSRHQQQQINNVFVTVNANEIQSGPRGGPPNRVALSIPLSSAIAFSSVNDDSGGEFSSSASSNTSSVDDFSENFRQVLIQNNNIYSSHNCVDSDEYRCGGGASSALDHGLIGLRVSLGKFASVGVLKLAANSILVTRGADCTALLIDDQSNYFEGYPQFLHPPSLRIIDVVEYPAAITSRVNNLIISRKNNFTCNQQFLFERNGVDLNMVISCVIVAFQRLDTSIRNSFIFKERNYIYYNRSQSSSLEAFGIVVSFFRFSGHKFVMDEASIQGSSFVKGGEFWTRPVGIFVARDVSRAAASVSTTTTKTKTTDDDGDDEQGNGTSPLTILISNVSIIFKTEKDAGAYLVYLFAFRAESVLLKNIVVSEEGNAVSTIRLIRPYQLIDVGTLDLDNISGYARGIRAGECVSLFDAQVDIDSIRVSNIKCTSELPPDYRHERFVSDGSAIDLRSFFSLANPRRTDPRFATRISISNVDFYCRRNTCLGVVIPNIGLGNVTVDRLRVDAQDYQSFLGIYVFALANDDFVQPYIAKNTSRSALKLHFTNSVLTAVDSVILAAVNVAAIELNISSMSYSNCTTNPLSVSSSLSVPLIHFDNVTAKFHFGQFVPQFPVRPPIKKFTEIAAFDFTSIQSCTLLGASRVPMDVIRFKQSSSRGCSAISVMNSKETPSRVEFLGGEDVICNTFFDQVAHSRASAWRIANQVDPRIQYQLGPVLSKLLRGPAAGPDSFLFEKCVNPSISRTVLVDSRRNTSKTAQETTTAISFLSASQTVSLNDNRNRQPNPQRTRIEIVCDGLLVAGGAASVSATSLGTVASFARMRSVLGVVQQFSDGSCQDSNNDEEQVDEGEQEPQIAEHPTRLKFSGAGPTAAWSAGMLVGNVVICFGLFALFIVGFYVYHMVVRLYNRRYQQQQQQQQQRNRHFKSFKDAVSRSQACGVLTFGFLMFLTPLSSALITVLASGGVRIMWRIAGVVLFLIFFVACCYYAHWGLFSRQREFDRYILRCDDDDDDGEWNERRRKDAASETSLSTIAKTILKMITNFVTWIVGPEGEWKVSMAAETNRRTVFGLSNQHRSPRRTRQQESEAGQFYSYKADFVMALPMFEGYCDRAPRFFIAEVGAMLVLGIAPVFSLTIAGLPGCVAHAAVVLTALVVFLFLLLKYRPYVDLLSRITAPATTIMEIVTVGIALSGATVNVLDGLIVALSSFQLIVSIGAFMFWLTSSLWPFLRRIVRKFFVRGRTPTQPTSRNRSFRRPAGDGSGTGRDVGRRDHHQREDFFDVPLMPVNRFEFSSDTSLLNPRSRTQASSSSLSSSSPSSSRRRRPSSPSSDDFSSLRARQPQTAEQRRPPNPASKPTSPSRTSRRYADHEAHHDDVGDDVATTASKNRNHNNSRTRDNNRNSPNSNPNNNPNHNNNNNNKTSDCDSINNKNIAKRSSTAVAVSGMSPSSPTTMERVTSSLDPSSLSPTLRRQDSDRGPSFSRTPLHAAPSSNRSGREQQEVGRNPARMAEDRSSRRMRARRNDERHQESAAVVSSSTRQLQRVKDQPFL